MIASDNYYTEHERRLLEEPRPQARDDEVEVSFQWQRGDLLGSFASPSPTRHHKRNHLALAAITIITISDLPSGSGAYGSVYLALNLDEGTLIAAKQVALAGTSVKDPGSNQFVQALVQEINVLRTLKHENIVQYFGTQQTNQFLNSKIW